MDPARPSPAHVVIVVIWLPLFGGTGSAVGSVFGALILRVISFNFRIFDVPPLMQSLVEGLILLGAAAHRVRPHALRHRQPPISPECARAASSSPP